MADASTAYASLADVEAILPPDEDMPHEPSNDDAPSREYQNLKVGLLEATDLVIGHLGREYTGEVGEDGVPVDVPPPVRRVVARVAMRAFTVSPDNPGAEAETQLMGPFSHTINWSKAAQDRDFYLTDSDEKRLERFCAASTSGAAHVPMYQVPCG